MDLTGSNFLEPSTLFSSPGGATLESNNGLCSASIKNPFLDSFSDPVCQLNLKETSDFVKSFPVASNGTESRGFPEILPQSVGGRNVEAPPTHGRPIFSFSNASFPRKSFPSKWNDAEKWLVSGGSNHDSPANNNGFLPSRMFSRQCSGYKPQIGEIFAEKSRITEEKVARVISTFQGPLVLEHCNSAGVVNGVALSATPDVLLKVNADKFPNESNSVSSNFGCSEPMREGFLFGNTVKKSMTEVSTEMVGEVKHRDIGTEMTPLGSSTTSRCPTPFKSTSPVRHNTPADRSGPLALPTSDAIDTTQLQECHLAKINLGTHFDSVTSNWSSREEEEEDVSKSSTLR